MRKIFLFIVAALFATNLWAECPARYVDTIPAQRYMTNMSLVIDDNESNWDWFSFEDTFRNDAGTKREELRTITIPILRNIRKINSINN